MVGRWGQLIRTLAAQRAMWCILRACSDSHKGHQSITMARRACLRHRTDTRVGFSCRSSCSGGRSRRQMGADRIGISSRPNDVLITGFGSRIGTNTKESRMSRTPTSRGAHCPRTRRSAEHAQDVSAQGSLPPSSSLRSSARGWSQARPTQRRFGLGGSHDRGVARRPRQRSDQGSRIRAFSCGRAGGDAILPAGSFGARSARGRLDPRRPAHWSIRQSARSVTRRPSASPAGGLPVAAWCPRRTARS